MSKSTVGEYIYTPACTSLVATKTNSALVGGGGEGTESGISSGASGGGREGGTSSGARGGGSDGGISSGDKGGGREGGISLGDRGGGREGGVSSSWDEPRGGRGGAGLLGGGRSVSSSSSITTGRTPTYSS